MTGSHAHLDVAAEDCLRALARSLDPATGFDEHVDLDPVQRNALELSGAAVVVVDSRRRILYFNQSASDLTGFTSEEVIGRTCTEGLRCTNCLRGCSLFNGGAFCQRHMELETRSGRMVQVVKSGRLLLDSDGRVVGGVETIHDVTDLHEQQQRQCALDVELERDLLRAFAENVDAGLAVIDARGAIRSLSARAEELLGVVSDQAQGEPLTALLKCNDDSLTAALATALRGGPRADIRGLRANRGPRGALVLRLTGLVGPDGDHLGAAAVLRAESTAEADEDLYGLIGRSLAMRRLLCQIRAVASTDATILIHGESGSGKELVARALHEASPRAGRPFHAVNCAALSENLVESELFGHERGSFTGAIRDKQGRLELAADGTLLLDEVGCLPASTQARLLRVLEAREFERVGGTRTIPMRARVVSATNADLEALVRRGEFREDLYYRLKVVPLTIPPLRKRRDDIALLARHFANTMREPGSSAAPDEALTREAIAAMERYDWPGNVRELRSAIQYALAVGGGTSIDVQDLPSEVRRAASVAPRSAEVERARIDRVLKETRYNRSEAATRLGMSRTTLWRKMRQWNLG